EWQALVRRNAPAIRLKRMQFLQDVVEDLDRQVIGEVEIGQGSAHPAPAEVPLLGALFEKPVADSLTLLRENGFLFYFRVKPLWRDNSPPEEFLAHASADIRCKHGILGDQQIDFQNFG